MVPPNNQAHHIISIGVAKDQTLVEQGYYGKRSDDPASRSVHLCVASKQWRHALVQQVGKSIKTGHVSSPMPHTQLPTSRLAVRCRRCPKFLLQSHAPQHQPCVRLLGLWTSANVAVVANGYGFLRAPRKCRFLTPRAPYAKICCAGDAHSSLHLMYIAEAVPLTLRR